MLWHETDFIWDLWFLQCENIAQIMFLKALLECKINGSKCPHTSTVEHYIMNMVFLSFTHWPWLLLLLLKVTKWGYVAAGHDNNMVATKLECKCHSGLSYNVTTNSWAQLSASEKKCQNTAVCIGADWKWQRRFSTWMRGNNCGVSTHRHTGPHWSCIRSDWSIFTSHHLPGRRKLGL